MFDRFTDRAKKVLSLARARAIFLQHDSISADHVLLGLLEEGTGVAANVLKNRSLHLDDLRTRIEQLLEPGRSPVEAGQLPFTKSAKRVLELSLEQAGELAHNYIGTEHLLLGMIALGDGIAAQVLREVGVELEAVRNDVLEFLGQPEDGTGERAPSAPSIGNAAVLRRLAMEAMRRHRAEHESDPLAAFVVLPVFHTGDSAAGDARSLDRLHREIIAPSLREAGATDVAIRGEPGGAQSLESCIRRANVVVVVLPGRDADVHYALGMAQALGREPIVIAARAADLPSELRGTKVLPLVFDGPQLAELHTRLVAEARRRIEQRRRG